MGKTGSCSDGCLSFSRRKYRPHRTCHVAVRQEASGWMRAGKKGRKAQACTGLTELVCTLMWEGGFPELFLDGLFIYKPK